MLWVTAKENFLSLPVHLTLGFLFDFADVIAHKSSALDIAAVVIKLGTFRTSKGRTTSGPERPPGKGGERPLALGFAGHQTHDETVLEKVHEITQGFEKNGRNDVSPLRIFREKVHVQGQDFLVAMR